MGDDFYEDVSSCIGNDLSMIFDVGANVGNVTRELAEAFPSSNIFSFEPVESTYRSLLANTRDIARVECANLALSDKKTNYEIYLQIENSWNSINRSIDRGLGKVSVGALTLDEFCRQRNIDKINLLKTDTEGHDLSVLKGAGSLLSAGKVDLIYSEFGLYKEDISHTYFCDLLEFLQGRQYQLFRLYDIDYWHISDDMEPRFPYGNALFVRNGIVRARHAKSYFSWLKSIGVPSAGKAD